MYDTLNPHGLHTLHPAARQRAKEDGCHEGSQHWFLQAKPLARVMPGHLLLLVSFQSVRCPSQTEHHHLERRDRKVLGHVWNRLGCLIIMVLIKWNNYTTTTEGVFVTCLRRAVRVTGTTTHFLFRSYRFWACHHGC